MASCSACPEGSVTFNMDPPNSLNYASNPPQGIEFIHLFGHVDNTNFDVIAGDLQNAVQMAAEDAGLDGREEPAVLLSGGRVRHLALDASFHIDWQRLKEAIGPHTRLIIVNFPNNPSGAIVPVVACAPRS